MVSDFEELLPSFVASWAEERSDFESISSTLDVLDSPSP